MTRWRDFLSHPQRHPEHGDAGLEFAGPPGLAAGLLYPQSADRWRRARRRICRGQQAAAVLGAHYVGSKACQSCHQEVYARWQKTAHGQHRARSQGPSRRHHCRRSRQRPIPTIVNFTKDDVAFVYGSQWKQRYFKKSGDTYVPLPAQWNIDTKKWSKYHVADNRRLVGEALSRSRGRQFQPAHRRRCAMAAIR